MPTHPSPLQMHPHFECLFFFFFFNLRVSLSCSVKDEDPVVWKTCAPFSFFCFYFTIEMRAKSFSLFFSFSASWWGLRVDFFSSQSWQKAKTVLEREASTQAVKYVAFNAQKWTHSHSWYVRGRTKSDWVMIHTTSWWTDRNSWMCYNSKARIPAGTEIIGYKS